MRQQIGFWYMLHFFSNEGRLRQAQANVQTHHRPRCMHTQSEDANKDLDQNLDLLAPIGYVSIDI